MPRVCRAAIVLALLAATAGVQAADTVTILRDRWGVPHIFTSGRDAGDRAAYANGYAQAEDRLFEMDVLRRAGTGRLAEMLGSGYLLMDEVVRRDGFTPVERGHFFRRLAARDRRALEAYRDGVNAFIAQVTAEPRRLPVEFGGCCARTLDARTTRSRSRSSSSWSKGRTADRR